MKIKKLTALAMTTAMCAATIFGCGSKEKKEEATKEEATKVQLKVWTPAEDGASGWTKDVCEAFADAHPEWNLEFEYEDCGEGDAYTMIKNDPTVAADVYMFANDQLGNLLSINGIAKLGGDVAQAVKNTNDEKIVATITKDDAIYGIPFTSNTWVMFYDKSVFSEDDVKNLDKMLEKGKVAYSVSNGWYLGAMYAAGGAEYSGPNGNDESAGVKLGDKKYEVTEYLMNLVKKDNFVADDGGAIGLAGLRDGSIKAYFSGSWDYLAVKEALGDNFAAAAAPTITLASGEAQLKPFGGSKAIGVNPNSKNMEQAVALAEFMANEESQLKHFQMRGVAPCNTNLLASDEVKADTFAQAQDYTIANIAVIQPVDAAFGTNYWGNAGTLGGNIVNGDITADNYVEKTDDAEKAMNGQ